MSGVFSRLGDSSDVDMESPISKRVGAQSTLPTKSSVIQAQKKADNTISFTVTGLGKVDPNNILNLSALSDVSIKCTSFYFSILMPLVVFTFLSKSASASSAFNVFLSFCTSNAHFVQSFP